MKFSKPMFPNKKQEILQNPVKIDINFEWLEMVIVILGL